MSESTDQDNLMASLMVAPTDSPVAQLMRINAQMFEGTLKVLGEQNRTLHQQISELSAANANLYGQISELIITNAKLHHALEESTERIAKLTHK